MTTNYLVEGIKIINNIGDEEIHQIPYNLNNILIEDKHIINILKNFNVNLNKINNIELFRKAMTHKSYCKKNIFTNEILEASKNELNNPLELIELRDESYERLELYGDTVLKKIITKYLFFRYPNVEHDQGFLTILKTKIEDKKNLAIFSKEIGLGKYFILSKHMETIDGRNSNKLHEDIFEAFLGALDLSEGEDIVSLLVINLLETLVDYSDKLYNNDNFKDKLLRYHHAQEWTHPLYCSIYSEGPSNKKKFIIGVKKHNININDPLEKHFIGYGIGNSIKEGEQKAAKMALINYGKLNEDQYSITDIFYPPWDKINNNEDNILKTQNIEKNDTENSIKTPDSDNDSILSDKSL
jgi:ribonuclease-3